MEPCRFSRLSISALSLRIPHPPKSIPSAVHSASYPFFCEIKLSHFDVQTAPVPLLSPARSEPDSHAVAASFYLDQPTLKKLLSNSCFTAAPCLQVSVYTGVQSSYCAAFSKSLLGKFTLPVGIEWASLKAVQVHHGWVCIGEFKAEGGRPGAELHLNVKVEPDPRYIFQFDGEPEVSPRIVQIHGNIRQPIFSCKFLTCDSSFRYGAGHLDGFGARLGEKEKARKERKGWLIFIHDLSGLPVAAAKMVTPFVPTSNSDRVCRSNPGAWLIMRAGPLSEDDWRPWGRLEAWRESGVKGGVGCRLQVVPEGGGVPGVNSAVIVSETVINAQKGGKFLIDTARLKHDCPTSASPVDSPHSSGDFHVGVGLPGVGGFVMSALVQGEGKSSKPFVQLAMRHVTCIEDAAVFMALAAAVDLSMDACLPFSKKLGKSFSSDNAAT